MSSFLEEEVEKESTSVYFTPPNFKDLFLTKVYPNSNHSVFTSSYMTNAEKIGVFFSGEHLLAQFRATSALSGVGTSHQANRRWRKLPG